MFTTRPHFCWVPPSQTKRGGSAREKTIPVNCRISLCLGPHTAPVKTISGPPYSLKLSLPISFHPSLSLQMSKLFLGLRFSHRLPWTSSTINLSHLWLYLGVCFQEDTSWHTSGEGRRLWSWGKVCWILLGTRRALQASWMSLTSDDQGWSGSLEVIESHESSLYPAKSGRHRSQDNGKAFLSLCTLLAS